MFYSVDSIEDGKAVLMAYDESTICVLQSQLAFGVAEGDIVEFQDGVYIKNEEETEKQKQITADLLKQLLQ